MPRPRRQRQQRPDRLRTRRPRSRLEVVPAVHASPLKFVHDHDALHLLGLDRQYHPRRQHALALAHRLAAVHLLPGVVLEEPLDLLLDRRLPLRPLRQHGRLLDRHGLDHPVNDHLSPCLRRHGEPSRHLSVPAPVGLVPTHGLAVESLVHLHDTRRHQRLHRPPVRRHLERRRRGHAAHRCSARLDQRNAALHVEQQVVADLAKLVLPATHHGIFRAPRVGERQPLRLLDLLHRVEVLVHFVPLSAHVAVLLPAALRVVGVEHNTQPLLARTLYQLTRLRPRHYRTKLSIARPVRELLRSSRPRSHRSRFACISQLLPAVAAGTCSNRHRSALRERILRSEPICPSVEPSATT
mmetsp:Transcript_6197/g.12541  ORF Transcript_6197/g.12541 Transcript_6197/m.12541 type:complete len:354 (+) Transcript_6197:2542-3603(+)